MSWRFHRYPDILGQETCFGYSNFYPLVISDSKTMASCTLWPLFTLRSGHMQQPQELLGQRSSPSITTFWCLLLRNQQEKFLPAAEWTRGDRSRAQLFINAVHFYLKSTMTFLNNHIFLFTSATRKLKAKFATQI